MQEIMLARCYDYSAGSVGGVILQENWKNHDKLNYYTGSGKWILRISKIMERN